MGNMSVLSVSWGQVEAHLASLLRHLCLSVALKYCSTYSSVAHGLKRTHPLGLDPLFHSTFSFKSQNSRENKQNLCFIFANPQKQKLNCLLATLWFISLRLRHIFACYVGPPKMACYVGPPKMVSGEQGGEAQSTTSFVTGLRESNHNHTASGPASIRGQWDSSPAKQQCCYGQSRIT